MRKYFIWFCPKNNHIYTCLFNVLCLVYSFLLLSSCNKLTHNKKEQYLYFDGSSNKMSMLYKIQDKSNNENQTVRKYIPIHTLTTHSKYTIHEGTYLIANECTSYEFSIHKNESKHIRLNTFQIKFFDSGDNIENVSNDHASASNENKDIHNFNVECINPISKEKVSVFNKSEFDILPGKNKIKIYGTNVLFTSDENQIKNFFIELVPLKVVSPIENDTTQYFLQPIVRNSGALNTLYEGQVSKELWLIPGEYSIEINGTKSITQIQPNQKNVIFLGRIRIIKPKSSPANEQLKSVTSPVFAYINKKILFSLDKDYAVFPEKYLINLEHSALEQEFLVSANESLVLQTYGAQINFPTSCNTENKNCNFSQKALIYTKDNHYTVAKVPLGTPFLVLHGDYQYSIEGSDGITKNLQISSDAIKIEETGKLKIMWKLQVSKNTSETRKVYLEPICCGLFGKSDDLNTYKPRELILPIGNYNLSYFTKQDKNSLKRNTIKIHIESNQVSEVQVPVYANSNQNINSFLQDEVDQNTKQEPSTLTPIAQ